MWWLRREREMERCDEKGRYEERRDLIRSVDDVCIG
jgi:hypothetical protein